MNMNSEVPITYDPSLHQNFFFILCPYSYLTFFIWMHLSAVFITVAKPMANTFLCIAVCFVVFFLSFLNNIYRALEIKYYEAANLFQRMHNIF